MKTKHTPTPWAEMNSHKSGFRNIVSWGDDEPQNRKFICEIAPSDTAVEDCSFIVKAANHHEELVSALETIAPLIGSALGRLRFSTPQDATILPLIQSLLAKLQP